MPSYVSPFGDKRQTTTNAPTAQVAPKNTYISPFKGSMYTADYQTKRLAQEKSQKEFKTLKTKALDISKLPQQSAYNQLIQARQAGLISKEEQLAKIKEINAREQAKIKSELQKSISPIEVAKSTAGTIGRGVVGAGGALVGALTSNLKRIGEGYGEAIGEATGVSGRARQTQLQSQQMAANTIKGLSDILRSPNASAEQKARARLAIQNISKTSLSTSIESARRQAEIAERTDPLKGLAAIGGIGLDVLTAGTLPAIKGAIKVGKGLSTAQKVAKTARPVAGGAGIGGVYGALSEIEQKGAKATPSGIAKSAGAGALFGGGLVGAGIVLPKAIQKIKSTKVAQEAVAKAKAPKAVATPKVEPIPADKISPDKLSKITANSILNKPVDIKPNRLEGKGYSLSEAKTGLTETGKNLPNRIVIGTNENGDVILKDGTHLLEAYRRQGIDIPMEKVKFENKKAVDAYQSITETPQVTKTPKTNGFFKDETEISQINRILKNEDTVAGGKKIADYYREAKGEDWRVVEMTPDEYLDRAAKAMGVDDAQRWRGAHTGDVEKYAADMKKGDKFPMPWINEVAGSQEGRTRALAAKLAGQDKIKVAVAEKYNPETYAARIKFEEDKAHNEKMLAILNGEKTPPKTPVGEQRVTGGAKKLEAQTGVKLEKPATYDETSYKTNKITSDEFVNNNKEGAFKALEDKTLGDVQRQETYKSLSRKVQEEFKKTGNIDDVQRLGRLGTTEEQSKAAQILGQSGYLADPKDPFKIINDVKKVKEKAVSGRVKITEQIKKDAVSIKSNIKAPTKQDWASFIDELRCK